VGEDRGENLSLRCGHSFVHRIGLEIEYHSVFPAFVVFLFADHPEGSCGQRTSQKTFGMGAVRKEETKTLVEMTLNDCMAWRLRKGTGIPEGPVVRNRILGQHLLWGQGRSRGQKREDAPTRKDRGSDAHGGPVLEPLTNLAIWVGAKVLNGGHDVMAPGRTGVMGVCLGVCQP